MGKGAYNYLHKFTRVFAHISCAIINILLLLPLLLLLLLLLLLIIIIIIIIQKFYL
jgi:hypothetical protein